MNHPRPLAGATLGRPSARLSAVGIAVLAAVFATDAAHGFEINTGNPDLEVRWDNTVRLNYGNRVESRDPKIGNNVVSDEGTYSFDRGDAVTKRLDLLTELDVVYKKNFGARVSAAGWYDGAYGDNSQTNPLPPLSNIPSYINKRYSDYTSRFYQGPSGEVLDAFVFGGTDIGNVPVRGKLGRQTLYWGESLFLGGNLHGVAYAQNPLDLQKGFATPGVEAKELFRPLNQVSGSAQITDTLSVGAQYMLQWESFRYPEGGTYLGPVDFAFNGPDRQFLSQALGFAARGNPSEPRNSGEGGLSARWSPAWLDGTMGFYWRNFADKLPQTFLTRVGPGISRYNLIYADNIDMYGVSLAKNIAGISVGAELSYRHDTPLNSTVLGIAPGLPAQGDTKGPRGDTYHGLVNAVGVIPKTALFDTASWAVELVWSQWSKVRSGANLFFAEGFAPCLGKNKWDGCTTKNYLGTGIAFTPTWFQVWPGVDLSMPVSYAVGLSGNAATVFGGNQDNGNYSIGLGADVYQKYRFDLKYIDYVGRYRANATQVIAQNGFTTLLKDRGFISLTFKTTF
ncbi:DUF1302 domain-containing protein [Variovorax sp. J22P240]|uniref:DUF1302 domain-containing protein n=1 Tax=unclassified Variovorax TaxID=663243 RepID=UPI002577BEDD|nr:MULTISPECIES: DUF1302 domain-containing protein [unclassified Variovorax]MDL9997501.1 DUF1302 domain-containing protein [Variovorax sp. J22P240]MDM0051537.1 DUF1302 domain-containing protein [Variovorax sp. J22R115]